MIQAKSLSGVIDLADNPPASPHTDLDTSDPLVLYIAKVPGNRDVFLTTTRPLQKVVTAQDIQSSLYYIHVDSQDDERLRETTGNNGSMTDESLITLQEDPIDHPPGSTSESLPSTDPYDALKGHPKSSLSAFPNPQGSSPVLSQPTIIARKPVGQGVQPTSPAVHSRLEPSGAQIIGPRAMHPRLHSVDTPGLRPAHGKENLMPRRWSEQPPVMQSSTALKLAAPGHTAASTRDPTPMYGNIAKSRNLDQGATSHPYHDGRRPSSQHADEGLSLTVIRRYDGSQWNVGKVFNGSRSKAHENSYAPSQPADVAIHINTPGYEKYHSFSPMEGSGGSQVFERRLLKPRRRSGDKYMIENNLSATNHRTPKMSIDFRKLSRPHVDGPDDRKEYAKQSPEGRSPSVKGYSFYSPWNGTCEFSSGVTGHALKCKHTAPERGSQAVTVSELRFNLPTSTGRGTSSLNVPRSPERPRSSKRNSLFFSKRGSESTLSETSGLDRTNDNDEYEPFDLSLGQEHAGGGFGGKQAKLGKLIIEPEGLKMLDLVVAANMGLWWKVYDKFA
ncbi:MAG: hypothetical protein Q9213_003212 [Squamulea squamosa]